MYFLTALLHHAYGRGPSPYLMPRNSAQVLPLRKNKEREYFNPRGRQFCFISVGAGIITGSQRATPSHVCVHKQREHVSGKLWHLHLYVRFASRKRIIFLCHILLRGPAADARELLRSAYRFSSMGQQLFGIYAPISSSRATPQREF